jgi:RNA polymerase sigma-70 factor (ECF subfamily)
MPDEAEAADLLALLLLLVEARRGSRIAPDGSLVLLADQDRSRWDRALIDEGHAIVRACLRRNRPGRESAAAFERAARLAPTEAEREFLRSGGRRGRMSTRVAAQE